MFKQNIVPVSWRYLLSIFIKIFILSQCSIILLILLICSKEILTFASLGTKLSNTFLFTLYQIPHILPITIPLCALFASLMLVFKLNQTHELSALRTLGFSLIKIFTPIFFFAGFLFLLNLFIVSEIASTAVEKSKKMLYEDTSINPLFIFQRKDLIKYKNIDISLNDKEHTIVYKDPKKNRLSLCLADSITTIGQEIKATNLSSIFYLNEIDTPSFLILENQDELILSKETFIKSIKKNKLKENTYALPMRSLLVKLKQEPQRASSILHEIERRFSIALFTFAFCIIGLTATPFTLRKVAGLLILCFFALIMHFIAKHFGRLTPIFYFLPSIFLFIYVLRYFINEKRRIA